MSRRILSLVVCRGLTRPSQLLAAGELIASLAEATGRSYVLVCSWPRDALVYGLYVAHDPRRAGEEVERRITGGPAVEASRGDTYVALVAHGYGSLEDVAVDASRLALCISASGYGATLLGSIGFIEAFTSRTVDPTIIERCLNVRVERGPTVNPLEVEGTARMFEQRSWRLYTFNRGSAEARLERGTYYVRLSVTVDEGYIVDWSLDSNMMAAPPMEIYSVLASVKGAPFHELTLSNLQLALEKRVQLYGVTVDDVKALLENLYTRVGVRHYT